MTEYPKIELEVVPECNDDDDNPCCWSMLAGQSYRLEDEFGKPSVKHYIWIVKYDEKEYIVEDSNGHNLTRNKVFKTLWGAKREAEGIAWRQNESGFFTD